MIIGCSVLFNIYSLIWSKTGSITLPIKQTDEPCYSLIGVKQNSLIKLFDNTLYIFDGLIQNRSTIGIIYHIIDYNTHKHYAIKQSDGINECKKLKKEYNILMKMNDNQIMEYMLYSLPNDYCISHNENVCLLQTNWIEEKYIKIHTSHAMESVFEMNHKANNKSMQYIIEQIMYCHAQLSDSLSILHSFNVARSYNVLYSYCQRDGMIKCYLTDFVDAYITDNSESFVSDNYLYKSSYNSLVYNNQNGEIKRDEYKLAVITIHNFINILLKYHKEFKHNQIILTNLDNLLQKIKELKVDISGNNGGVWHMYLDIVYNIKHLFKNNNIDMNEYINAQFNNLLQIIIDNFENYGYNLKQFELFNVGLDDLNQKYKQLTQKHNELTLQLQNISSVSIQNLNKTASLESKDNIKFKLETINPKTYLLTNTKWKINIETKIRNYNCNKAVYHGRAINFANQAACCSLKYDNKYLTAKYMNKSYNFKKQNDISICELLLITSNKSILIVGDSLSKSLYHNFIGDIFEKQLYKCMEGYIKNITIESYEKIPKGFSYEISFIHYRKNALSNNYVVKKHKTKWSKFTFYGIYPSFIPKFGLKESLIINANNPKNTHYYFNLNKKLINYSMLNANRTEWMDNKLIYTMNFTYFMNNIKNNEYDSIIMNCGAHYTVKKMDINNNTMIQYRQNQYKYIINFLANILENDKYIRKQTSKTSKIHIWRMTTPSHWHKHWWDRLNYNNSCVQQTYKRYETNKLEFELFENSNYSIPIIDYYSVLQSRGFLHLTNKTDCLHWCTSNILFKPFWWLLSKIYHDYGWKKMS